MEVITTTPSSWLLTDANRFDSQATTTPVETITKQEVPVPVTEIPPTPVAETPKEILPTGITDLFARMKGDKTLDFAYYEDQKIESYEDIVDFIGVNTNLRYENSLKHIDNDWYQSKTPVFQQFAQMAELAGNDVNKLYGMIETQKIIEDFSSFDTNDQSHADIIIENYLKLKGDSPEMVESELRDYRERGISSARAEAYKPLLLNHYEGEKQNKLAQEQNSINTFHEAINQNEKSIINFLSEKEIGGLKLNASDKDLVYSNLSYNNQLQGFPLYKKIEELQSRGNFGLLSKAILLLENEERFDEIYTNRVRGAVAKDLRGKLRYASDSTENHQVQAPPKAPQAQDGKVYNPWK